MEQSLVAVMPRRMFSTKMTWVSGSSAMPTGSGESDFTLCLFT